MRLKNLLTGREGEAYITKSSNGKKVAYFKKRNGDYSMKGVPLKNCKRSDVKLTIN
jgi:hypothetical protein